MILGLLLMLSPVTVTYSESPVLYADITPASVPNAPVLILVHGGKWRMGSRTEMAGVARRFPGFVTMSVDYRMACKPSRPPLGVDPSLCGYHFPTADQDVQTAVDWAAANIAAYGGDPSRIYVLGSSAGAQIALDIGTSGHGVVGVAAWSPPTDFENCLSLCGPMQNYIGCSITACPEMWYQATARHFAATAVPAYVANSTDEQVPLAMPEAFIASLTTAYEFDVLPGTLHAKGYKDVKLSDGLTVAQHTAAFLTGGA